MRRAGAALALGGLALVAAGPAQTERRAASDFHLRAPVDGQVKPGAAYAVPLSQEPGVAIGAPVPEGGELQLTQLKARQIVGDQRGALVGGEANAERILTPGELAPIGFPLLQ